MPKSFLVGRKYSNRHSEVEGRRPKERQKCQHRASEHRHHQQQERQQHGKLWRKKQYLCTLSIYRVSESSVW